MPVTMKNIMIQNHVILLVESNELAKTRPQSVRDTPKFQAIKICSDQKKKAPPPGGSLISLSDEFVRFLRLTF
jgi:hypothetical protein